MTDWTAIVREHGPMAFQTAWRILGHVQDTEDAVQEALLEGLRAYRAGEVQNWGGLLRRAATCRALDRLRQRRPLTPIPESVPSPAGERPDQIAEARELAAWLRGILSTLPERQAQVFSLRYFGEVSNPEIAAALRISVDAVAVALHKARTAIAQKRNERQHSSRSQAHG